jgi:hypothetical protein
MTSFIVVCVFAYGLAKLGKFIKNNPGQSLEAAKWIKGMFGR